jgi:hypothetical protein
MGAALAAPAQATTSLSSGYVTPTTGGNTTKFTWRVKFWNTAGVLPDAVKLAIWSTGTGTRWFTMWPLEPGDTNVVDGKWYTASMTLPARDRRDPRSDGGLHRQRLRPVVAVRRRV